MKVARGRSWQPEIGMEHASRGRRSGNKGVGARWRGRFRIFSARHCSRTKVSHAENSGMTMGGDSFTCSGEDGTRGLGDWGILSQAQERRHEEVFGLGDSFAVGLGAVAGACVGRGSGQPRMPPRERQHEGLGDWGILSQAQEWSDTHAASGETARGDFWFGGFFHTLRSGCTRSLGWWWALLGLTESNCGGGDAPARWRGRFRIFSATAGAAPENSGMTTGGDSFTCSGAAAQGVMVL